MLYLIDFGLSKQEKKEHKEHKENDSKTKMDKVGLIGSEAFASIRAHTISLPYRYRDDLESMIYFLSFLATGKLPWLNFLSNDDDSE